MRLRSIRWQIQLWHGILLAIVVLGLLILGSYHERISIQLRIDRELMGLTPTVLLHHFPPPSSVAEVAGTEPHRAWPVSNPNQSAPVPQVPSSDNPLPQGDYYHVVWDAQGNIIARSPNLPEGLEHPRPVQIGWVYRYANGGRELLHLHPSGYVGIVGISTDDIDERLISFHLWSWGAGFSLVLGAWLVGAWLVKRSLWPLVEISQTARRIAGGDLDERISLERAYEELRELSATLNQTFDRLGRAVRQQVEFTADASHELRTPLAIILAEVQSGLRKNRSPDEYRNRLETCHVAAQHMRNLVDALMQLARIDAGRERLEISEVDLKELLGGCGQMLQPLARSKQISIESRLSPVIARVDAPKFQQVVLNLLTNAIQHSGEGTLVRMNLRLDQSHVIVGIIDEGPGIPLEERGRIFDRFHQGDESHYSGGVGLGLAISRAIVELHRGTIEVDCPREGGACFTIRIPADLE